MPNRREVINSAVRSKKTMSTLQMWQHQMAALQRASEVRNESSQSTPLGRNASELHSSEDSRSTLIYPHIL
ncbi:hypothetical protein NBRC116583_10290 [Arenicella sp. 4NH20-0111]|uniref:hypothetical protein n=1 Tax=Arenicella sp. 4NH20-0111 TaxID=3127648 RepID=UPI003104BD38